MLLLEKWKAVHLAFVAVIFFVGVKPILATYYEASLSYREQALNATELPCGSEVEVAEGKKYVFDSAAAIIYEASLYASQSVSNNPYPDRRRKRAINQNSNVDSKGSAKNTKAGSGTQEGPSPIRFQILSGRSSSKAESQNKQSQTQVENQPQAEGRSYHHTSGYYSGNVVPYTYSSNYGGGVGYGYPVKPSVCQWTYHAAKNCSLEMHIVRFRSGDTNCYKQEFSVNDNHTEYKLCGHRKLYPGFRAETPVLYIKYWKLPYTYRHTFKGYVTCVGRTQRPTYEKNDDHQYYSTGAAAQESYTHEAIAYSGKAEHSTGEAHHVGGAKVNRESNGDSSSTSGQSGERQKFVMSIRDFMANQGLNSKRGEAAAEGNHGQELTVRSGEFDKETSHTDAIPEKEEKEAEVEVEAQQEPEQVTKEMTLDDKIRRRNNKQVLGSSQSEVQKATVSEGNEENNENIVETDRALVNEATALFEEMEKLEMKMEQEEAQKQNENEKQAVDESRVERDNSAKEVETFEGEVLETDVESRSTHSGRNNGYDQNTSTYSQEPQQPDTDTSYDPQESSYTSQSSNSQSSTSQYSSSTQNPQPGSAQYSNSNPSQSSQYNSPSQYSTPQSTYPAPSDSNYQYNGQSYSGTSGQVPAQVDQPYSYSYSYNMPPDGATYMMPVDPAYYQYSGPQDQLQPPYDYGNSAQYPSPTPPYASTGTPQYQYGTPYGTPVDPYNYYSSSQPPNSASQYSPSSTMQYQYNSPYAVTAEPAYQYPDSGNGQATTTFSMQDQLSVPYDYVKVPQTTPASAYVPASTLQYQYGTPYAAPVDQSYQYPSSGSMQDQFQIVYDYPPSVMYPYDQYQYQTPYDYSGTATQSQTPSTYSQPTGTPPYQYGSPYAAPLDPPYQYGTPAYTSSPTPSMPMQDQLQSPYYSQQQQPSSSSYPPPPDYQYNPVIPIEYDFPFNNYNIPPTPQAASGSYPYDSVSAYQQPPPTPVDYSRPYQGGADSSASVPYYAYSVPSTDGPVLVPGVQAGVYTDQSLGYQYIMSSATDPTARYVVICQLPWPNPCIPTYVSSPVQSSPSPYQEQPQPFMSYDRYTREVSPIEAGQAKNETEAEPKVDT